MFHGAGFGVHLIISNFQNIVQKALQQPVLAGYSLSDPQPWASTWRLDRENRLYNHPLPAFEHFSNTGRGDVKTFRYCRSGGVTAFLGEVIQCFQIFVGARVI